MIFDYKGIAINYKDEGQGIPLLLLHGWGCNLSHLDSLTDYFRDSFRVIVPDIPGFGASDEPDYPWGTRENADAIAALATGVGAERPICFGHSNGGRIAIELASRGLARGLVLADSAGIPPQRGADYYFKVYSYKAMKKVLNLPGLRGKKEEILERRRQKTGSADYQAASPMMRQIMSKVVNEDLSPQLSRISVPALLLWGAKDTDTPLADGERMTALLKAAGSDAALIVFENCGHFAFLEENYRFLRVMEAFLAAFKPGK